jgi:hypothetical protein
MADPRLTVTVREAIALDMLLGKAIDAGDAPAPIYSLAAKIKDKLKAFEEELEAIGGPAPDA